MFANIEQNKCARCDKLVYFAEQVIALSKYWHKSCFLCANPDCKRRLDSRSCADHDGDAYCMNCHRRMFGPKGYGSAGLTMETPVSKEHNEKAEKEMSHSARVHVAVLGNRNVSTGDDDSCDGTPEKINPQLLSPTGSTGSAVDLSVLSAPKPWSLHDNSLCRRCGRTVYFAEQARAAGGVWHKTTCFTCALCTKRVEPGKLCEKGNEIICKTCYGRHFGPKGYGVGVGAGTLHTEL